MSYNPAYISGSRWPPKHKPKWIIRHSLRPASSCPLLRVSRGGRFPSCSARPPARPPAGPPRADAPPFSPTRPGGVATLPTRQNFPLASPQFCGVFPLKKGQKRTFYGSKNPFSTMARIDAPGRARTPQRINYPAPCLSVQPDPPTTAK